MKKLVVLALLLAAGMLWAQAPAGPTFTMGLTLDYMWANDFGPGKEFSDRPILELKFNWVADDLTTAYVELEEGPMGSQGDTAVNTSGTANGNPASPGGFRTVVTTLADAGYDVKITGLDKAYFTTNLGKAFKLPVPVSVMYGYNEWNNKDGIKVTKTEFEDWLGEADIRNWGAQIEVTPDPAITLRANWAWNPGSVDGGKEKGQLMVGAYGTIAPITYEATFFTHGMALGKNWIEGGLEFNQDITPAVNVALSFAGNYDLATASDYTDLGAPAGFDSAYGWASAGSVVAPDAQYMLQVGAELMFNKMLGLGLAWRGAEDMIAGALQPQFYFTPKAGDPMELFAQLGLGLDSDAFDTMFDSAEVALRYTMGKVQWYLGFLWGADLNRGIAREWSDFDVAGMVVGKVGGETTAIFMRGRVAL